MDDEQISYRLTGEMKCIDCKLCLQLHYLGLKIGVVFAKQRSSKNLHIFKGFVLCSDKPQSLALCNGQFSRTELQIDQNRVIEPNAYPDNINVLKNKTPSQSNGATFLQNVI